VVTSYNAVSFLPAAIESVLAQTYTDFELIIVDDGSSDGSGELALSYKRPGVHVIRQSNQGPAAALNAGLRLAQGVYAAILDGDDTWHPEKLSCHVDCFEQHRDADLTFSWSDWIDESGRATGLHTQHCHGTFSLEALFEDFVIGNTSSVVIRRSCLEAAGLCDLDFARYYDVDLFLRIARGGAEKVRAIPRTLTGYRRHSGQMSRDWRAMEQEWRKLVARHRDAVTPGVAARGSSNMARYFAFLAYESGCPVEAVAMLRRGFQQAPAAFLRDPRNWKMSAAVASALLLPARWHGALEEFGRRRG